MSLQAANDFRTAQVQQADSGNVVVPVDVGTTHATVSSETNTAVEHTPVVKHQALTGLELDNDLKLLAGQNIVPQSDGLVELDDVSRVLPLVHNGAVTVVPADLHQLPSLVVVSEDWQGHGRSDADFLFACTMSGNESLGQHVIGFRRLLLQHLGSIEGVNQHVFTALTVVVKHVEQLQARGVRPVGSVSVGGNSQVGVGSIILCQISGKVPESSVVSGFDVRQTLNQFFSILGVDWDVVDHAKS